MDALLVRPAAPIEVPPAPGRSTSPSPFSEYDYGDGRTFDERISHAWLSFAAAAPARWRQARSGRRPIEVDVGGSIACFASAAAAASIAEAFIGAGDGGCSVYLGLAADGSLAAVAVDFELVPELVEEPWRGRFEIVWS